MLQGKVKAALRVISKDTKGGVLAMDDLIQIGINENGDIIQKTTRNLLEENTPKERKLCHRHSFKPRQNPNSATTPLYSK